MEFLRLGKSGLVLCSASIVVKQIVQVLVPGLVDSGSPQDSISFCCTFPSIFREALQRFAWGH